MLPKIILFFVNYLSVLPLLFFLIFTNQHKATTNLLRALKKS